MGNEGEYGEVYLEEMLDYGEDIPGIRVVERDADLDGYSYRMVTDTVSMPYIEAIGLYLEEDLQWGILREQTGDEREFQDLEDGGRVLARTGAESYDQVFERFCKARGSERKYFPELEFSSRVERAEYDYPEI